MLSIYRYFIPGRIHLEPLQSKLFAFCATRVLVITYLQIKKNEVDINSVENCVT